MTSKGIYVVTLGCGMLSASALAGTQGQAQSARVADAGPVAVSQTGPQATAERIDIDAALAAARFVGMGDQRELIVPLPMNDEARAVGAIGRQISYKGVCGPDGAVATPEQLLEHARRDLERMNNPSRGTATQVIGESPRFVVSYNPTDPVLVGLFLPSFINAAEYVDSQLDDRVEIQIDLSTADLDGNTIGSAGSTQFIFDYNIYRLGLQAADDRIPEESNFADALPPSTLPVRYDGSSTTTNETRVVANMTQVRAIFGETVLDQSIAITITLDNTADWDYFVYLDDQVNSGDLSLVDVAVH
jgi:hypothetical protein